MRAGQRGSADRASFGSWTTYDVLTSPPLPSSSLLRHLPATNPLPSPLPATTDRCFTHSAAAPSCTMSLSSPCDAAVAMSSPPSSRLESSSSSRGSTIPPPLRPPPSPRRLTPPRPRSYTLFSFLWVPAIQEDNIALLPFGYISAAFMLSMTLGSILYPSVFALSSPSASSSQSSLLTNAKLVSSLSALAALSIAFGLVHPGPQTRFYAFCLLHTCLGMYSPLQRMLHNTHVANERRAALSSLSRLLTSVIVVVVLVAGVDSGAMTDCALMLACSSLATEWVLVGGWMGIVEVVYVEGQKARQFVLLGLASVWLLMQGWDSEPECAPIPELSYFRWWRVRRNGRGREIPGYIHAHYRR
ncbi:hypothetical protein R3P38DRAFT_3201239 [Favolaschia claudopus]|uniref:Uncharacterized protein n=1 Tax=Favolaschia claudopus TaxID=2862362 RepID=A0AAW0AY84_9AGAR